MLLKKETRRSNYNLIIDLKILHACNLVVNTTILDLPRTGRLHLTLNFYKMINLKSTNDLETINSENLQNIKGGISNAYSAQLVEESEKKDVDSTSGDSYSKD